MELSHESIRNLVYDQVKKLYPDDEKTGQYTYIESMFDTSVIFKYAGDFWKAAYSIEGNAAKIGKPEKVLKTVSFEPILFSFSEEAADGQPKEFAEGDYVVKTGKVFEAGDYPDKNVAFSEKDLENAVETFAPVPNDLEHKQTILDGQLGGLRKVWKKGNALYGQVAIPKWLDSLLKKKKEPLKVSLSWNADKKIVGNALTLRPRIEDAVVFAAFSDSEAGEGQKETNMKVTIKQVLSKLLGSGDLNAEVDISQASFTDEKPAVPVVTQPPVPASPTPDNAEFSRQLEAMKAAQANAAKASLQVMAKEFANSQVHAGKIAPAQAEAVAALFSQAATMDNGGVVNFSDDGTIKLGANVEQLKAFFANQPKLLQFSEQFEGRPLEFAKSGAEADPERINRLLSLTPMGRDILKKGQAK